MSQNVIVCINMCACRAVRGVADSVSMWNSVERLTTFASNIPQECEIAANLDAVRARAVCVCACW